MPRTLLAVLLTAALFSSVLPALLHFVAVDRCLDAGGVFDYSARICRRDVESLPVPRPQENADFVSSAVALRLRGFVRLGGLILLVGLALVALNNAAASAWLAGGPPTPYPRAWWGEAVRCSWSSVAFFLTGIWLCVALRARAGEGRAPI